MQGIGFFRRIAYNLYISLYSGLWIYQNPGGGSSWRLVSGALLPFRLD